MFFNLISAVVDEWEDATMFSYLDFRDKTAVLTKRMKYFANYGKQTQHFSLILPVNLFSVKDLSG